MLGPYSLVAKRGVLRGNWNIGVSGFMGMVYSVTGVNFRICSNKHKNREEMPFLIIREDVNWEKKRIYCLWRNYCLW